jgi:hypothetical protein
MPSFDDLWDNWMNLADDPTPDIQALSALKDDILSGLQEAQSREDRKALAGLLATVQNRIVGQADNNLSKDEKLVQVLKQI